MRTKWACAGLLGLLMLGGGWFPALAGDSLQGKVIAVKSANVVTFDYGAGRYDLRLVGFVVPKDGPLAAEAVQLVSRMVLGKKARMRFEGRGEDGAMRSRLFTADPALGIREVARELVRTGLARRQEGFDFKYGELAAAESEARAARRGIWAAVQPR